jgi:hypothetical protein
MVGNRTVVVINFRLENVEVCKDLLDGFTGPRTQLGRGKALAQLCEFSG